MPIYEYRRSDGTTFEVLQSMRDEALTVDPETGLPVERVLHAPAVHFKGSGFYNTDYGTRKRAREKEAAGGGEAGASTKDDGGSSGDGAAKKGEASGGGGGEKAASSSSSGDSSPS